MSRFTPSSGSPLPGAPIFCLDRSGGRDVFSGMAEEILRGGVVIFLCGDNRFIPDIFVRKAREAGRHPGEILSRLALSRAFTIHQLLASVRQPLEREVERTSARLAVLTGLVPLFLAASVPAEEALDILERLLQSLGTLSRTGVRVLLPLTLPVPDTRLSRSIFETVIRKVGPLRPLLPFPTTL